MVSVVPVEEPGTVMPYEALPGKFKPLPATIGEMVIDPSTLDTAALEAGAGMAWPLNWMMRLFSTAWAEDTKYEPTQRSKAAWRTPENRDVVGMVFPPLLS